MTYILVFQILGALVFIYVLACLVMYLLQEKFIFVPAFRTPLQPVDVATPLDEFEWETSNGGSIHSILLKPKTPSKGIIFYLHGNTGTLRRWQFMAEELTTYGWDVFAMDYRGFGKSTGKRSESFMHQDVLDVFDKVKALYPDRKMVVYGRSLGTGFATQLAAKRPNAGLILETPFYNLINLANAYFPYLFNRLLLKYQMRSDKWIQKVDAPIIIFQGTKDRVVPFRSARKLFAKVEEKPQAKMITLPGGKHGDLNKFPLFTSGLSDFLASL